MSGVPVSFDWLSGCSGCELGLVDLHERLLAILEAIDIVRLPILMDTKDYPKAAVGIVTGALRTTHDVEAARRMRETCDKLLAFGTCAVYGGPQGAANAHSLEDLARAAFVDNPTTQTHFMPDQGVPELLPEGVRPVDSEVEVDLYLPGCPPHAHYIFEALKGLLEGRDPDFGPENVCYRCNRKMKHTDVKALRRIHEGPIDPELCFLSQGILCMGSVSLERCLAPCPRNGVACSGCAGPSENVILEPQKDIRSELATRMAMMTQIPKGDIQREIELRAKTHYAYAMASPVFRQKPTFLIRKWISQAGD